MVYCFLLQVNSYIEHLLAFIQKSTESLPKALQDLRDDPVSPVLLAQVVGLLVRMMAATGSTFFLRRNHRMCFFLGGGGVVS